MFFHIEKLPGTNNGYEDDPYYLLYYGNEARPDSYFTLEGKDNEGTGIVLRFDSLSKVLSSGLRVAFVTGPTPVLEKMELLVKASCLTLLNVFTHDSLHPLHTVDGVGKSTAFVRQPIYRASSLEPLGCSRV